MTGERWRDAAACRTMGPALFWPKRGAASTFDAAIAVCAGCPVREPCLEYALAHGIRSGVWGGASPNARKALAAKRRRARAAGAA